MKDQVCTICKAETNEHDGMCDKHHAYLEHLMGVLNNRVNNSIRTKMATYSCGCKKPECPIDKVKKVITKMSKLTKFDIDKIGAMFKGLDTIGFDIITLTFTFALELHKTLEVMEKAVADGEMSEGDFNDHAKKLAYIQKLREEYADFYTVKEN